ncbi:MAG: polyketide synthase, partial [Chitinivibrionales bacterium]|nr:polyketide synthase [Chitinivibrionales bacterium]MBD3358370.1 polyketide synthase [Chitinivibrionales bacterium]
MLGIVPLSTTDGLRAYENIIGSERAQIAVLMGDASKIRSVLFGHVQEQKYDPSPQATPRAAPALDMKERTQQLLKEKLSRVSKMSIDKIDAKAPLEKYGFDSVLILNLIRELEKQFGELSKTLLFEYRNIKELTDYFVNNHAETLATLFHQDKESTTAPAARKELPTHAVPIVPAAQKRFAKRATRSNGTEETDVAIIGLSGRYPHARNLREFWANLETGRDCIEEIPPDRWDNTAYFDPTKGKLGKTYGKWGSFLKDIDKFDSLFFNISPREADFIDPQERLFMETAWSTVEDAGYRKSDLEGSAGAVYVGIMYGHYQIFGGEQGKDWQIPLSSYSAVANRVSYLLDWHGPSMGLDSMCSSSLSAIHLACQSILSGESEIALAGGVNLTVHPNKYLQLSHSRFLASDGRCRSFGEGGDGYVPGEGVGAVLLKLKSKALEDNDQIYGVIKASALNHGGKTNGFFVPNPKAQRSLISDALKKSNIHPRTISYCEAHGTGTSLGDPIEITGLRNAFEPLTKDKQFCPIGSVKSNLGHLESAAGIVGLTKILLQMRHTKLVPSIHSSTLNPYIPFEETPFYVQRKLEPWKRPVVEINGTREKVPRRACISSFGAGGANAHLIIEEHVDTTKAESFDGAGPQLIVLSAKNRDRLHDYARRLTDFCRDLKEQASVGTESDRAVEALKAFPSLRDIAYTLQIGREPMESRLAMVVGTIDDITEKLDGFLAGNDAVEGIFHDMNESRNASAQNGAPLTEIDLTRIRALINEQRLEELAHLWIRGATIDWEALHSESRPRRVSLPTYPFARKRHWFDSNVDRLGVINSSADESKGHIATEHYSVSTENERSTAEAGERVHHEDDVPVDAPSTTTSTGANDRRRTMIAELKAVLSSVLFLDDSEFSEYDPLQDFGIDSILGVELMNKINEQFDIELTISELFTYTTLDELAQHLLEQVKETPQDVAFSPKEPPIHVEAESDSISTESREKTAKAQDGNQARTTVATHTTVF